MLEQQSTHQEQQDISEAQSPREDQCLQPQVMLHPSKREELSFRCKLSAVCETKFADQQGRSNYNISYKEILAKSAAARAARNRLAKGKAKESRGCAAYPTPSVNGSSECATPPTPFGKGPGECVTPPALSLCTAASSRSLSGLK